MSGRLNVSPDAVIDIILSDEKLVKYVLKLVKKRLSSEMASDPAWCNKVIDMSIDQVLHEINIMELLRKVADSYIKPPAEEHEESFLKPHFSVSEPQAVEPTAPRRVVKKLNKQTNNLFSTGKERTEQLTDPRRNIKHGSLETCSASVESDASTIPVNNPIIKPDVTESSNNKKAMLRPQRVEMLHESAVCNSVNNGTKNAFSDACSDSSISSVFEEEGVYASFPSNEPTASSPRNEGAIPAGVSPLAEAVNDDDFLNSWEKQVLAGIRDVDESVENSTGIAKPSGSNKGISLTSKQNVAGNLKLSTAVDAESSDSDSYDDDEDGEESDSAKENGGEEDISDEEDGTGSCLQKKGEIGLRSAMKKEEEGGGEEEESAGDDDSTSDVIDKDSEGYFASSPVHGGSLLFFDQARFDADADYFSAVSSGKYVPPVAGSKKAKAGKKATAKVKQSKSVKFAPTIITEIHYRDRVGWNEREELFFSHNEEYQFTLDQTREAERAEAAGLTWMEWIDRRTDEDIRREEEAEEEDSLDNFQLYSGEYFEEAEPHHAHVLPAVASQSALPGTANDDDDDDDDDAHSKEFGATSSLSAANTTGNSGASSGGAGGVSKGGAGKVPVTHGGASGPSFDDELSVPSVSEDEENEFDDF
jgi:hypothetical protein